MRQVLRVGDGCEYLIGRSGDVLGVLMLHLSSPFGGRRSVYIRSWRGGGGVRNGPSWCLRPARPVGMAPLRLGGRSDWLTGHRRAGLAQEDPPRMSALIDTHHGVLRAICDSPIRLLWPQGQRYGYRPAACGRLEADLALAWIR